MTDYFFDALIGLFGRKDGKKRKGFTYRSYVVYFYKSRPTFLTCKSFVLKKLEVK